MRVRRSRRIRLLRGRQQSTWSEKLPATRQGEGADGLLDRLGRQTQPCPRQKMEAFLARAHGSTLPVKGRFSFLAILRHIIIYSVDYLADKDSDFAQQREQAAYFRASLPEKTDFISLGKMEGWRSSGGCPGAGGTGASRSDDGSERENGPANKGLGRFEARELRRGGRGARRTAGRAAGPSQLRMSDSLYLAIE